jgi:hypothetical protein
VSSETKDDLILRHLDGETSGEEVAEVTRLLADDPTFRSRFHTLVSHVARLREILDTPPSTPGDAGMKAQPPVAAPRQQRRAPATLPEIVSKPLPARNIDFRRIYFNAVVGGVGGLLGWLAISVVEGWTGAGRLNVYLHDAVIGLVVGLCLGGVIGSTEGLIASRSLRRVWLGARYGLILGAAGGVLGLVLGEALFAWAGGGVWPRALGWALFGMFVGSGEGVAHRMPAKIRFGILGGLLGGLIGGSTYEGLVAVLRGGGGLDTALAWGSAIGLILLGACIGLMVGLVESLLRKAWLFFLTGRLEGQTRTLDSGHAHTIGSADTCSTVVASDATLAPVHAEITFLEGEFRVRPREGAVTLRREGVDCFVESPEALEPGDRIIIGETRMIFRNVEGKKS